MTLSISPTRSGLTTTIVCKGCEHLAAVIATTEFDDRSIWVDTNNDVYFQGVDLATLEAFTAIHR